MESPLHRCIRERKELGDPRHRPTLEIVEVQRKPLRLRQLRQRLPNTRALMVLHVLLRRMHGQGRTLRQDQAVEPGGFGRFAMAFPLPKPLRAMSSDRVEPACKPGGVLQLGQRFEGQ